MRSMTRSRSVRTDRSEPGGKSSAWVRTLFAFRIGRIPHLGHRMRLRHKALEIVDEALAAVLRVLVVPADVDRFLRADFLAVAAEDAAELVDLEYERIAVALLVFTRHELDAVRRADGRA